MTGYLERHVNGESIGRFPVWMMRQAGRYLPSYRAIRERYSFWEMVTKSDVAVEVSLLPLSELDVDGVILFSDILSLPYGFGIPIEMKEQVGPTLPRPMTLDEFQSFSQFQPTKHTGFVCEALSGLSRQIPKDKTLIGFAGAPWTVGCYLLGGRGNRFEAIKIEMYKNPEKLSCALDALAEATARYLVAQTENGARLVQLFDTWVMEMPRWFFVNYYLPNLNRIFDALKGKVSCIYFSRNAHHLIDVFAQLHADGLGCDSLVSLDQMAGKTEKRFFLQGNLDPLVLLGDEASVRKHTRDLVQTARKVNRPVILNLGHGILPQTPVSNAKAFVEEAKVLWA
ncbi:MAG: uroporphyrinogen decarboxylase [Deltaproteobacteria bacterium]|nr:uroporphyrinogen decarboxylase [Deltaproteobacteria bacterium]